MENKEPISKQIKQKFFHILETSTFHGLPHIFLSKSLSSKLLWLIASLFSLSYCIYLVINSVLDYYKHDVVTRFEANFDKRPLFPQVDICGHNRTNVACIFDREACDAKDITSNNRCDTFNAANSLISKDSGDGSGLQLNMHALDSIKGISVHIHNHSYYSASDTRYISPGMRTTLIVRRVFEERLPAPYSNCKTNGKDTVYEYHQSQCFDYCKFYLIAENCILLEKLKSFSDSFYSNFTKFNETFYSSIIDNCTPALVSQVQASFKEIGVHKLCMEMCPIACTRYSFTISSLGFRLPENVYPKEYAELIIFYETFEYTMIAQYAKVNSDVVLGTVGGLVGLFLGASILSFGELAEFLIAIIRVLFTRAQAKRLGKVPKRNTKKKTTPSLAKE